MSSSEPPSAKPSAPPFLQWMMRITGAVALLLFLTPTFYVVKYYAIDRPREEALPISPFLSPQQFPVVIPKQADSLSWLEKRTRDDTPDARLAAIRQIGSILQMPGIGWKRPLECLSAKATLAELATKDPDSQVRAAASEELEKVAQSGAVIQR